MILALLISVAVNILLAVVLTLVIKSKSKGDRNIEAIIDHSTTDATVREIQQSVKKKIIEAKNEKESDDAIRSIRSAYSKL